MSSVGHSQPGRNMNETRYDGPQIAAQYDDFYTKPVYRYENRIAEEVLKPYAFRSVVLDLGAGTGLVQELAHPLAYVAVDNSNEMLRVLTQKYSGVFTIVADLMTPAGLKHLDETATYVGPFDLITTLWAGHSFHSQELFNLLYSLLVPNGTIVYHGNFMRRRFRESPPFLDMTNEMDPAYKPSTLRNYLRVAGFKDVRTVGFNAVPDWITNRVPETAALKLMRASQHIPARFHFHGAVIGRKPYGN